MFRLFVFITAVALYPVSSVFAEETKLKELCLALNNSQNAKNDANYIGGVDVHGNSVVSADINTHALVPTYNPVDPMR